MIFWLVLSLISAPIIKEEIYTLQVKSCLDGQVIGESGQSTYAISLFNLAITSKEGYEYACTRLYDAQKVEFKVDTYATVVDHITAWIFVDGTLLQKEMVERGFAKIMIDNPEYGYHDQMKEAAIVANASIVTNVNSTREFDRNRGKIFLLFNFGGLFLMLVGVFIYNYVKKRRFIKK